MVVDYLRIDERGPSNFLARPRRYRKVIESTVLMPRRAARSGASPSMPARPWTWLRQENPGATRVARRIGRQRRAARLGSPGRRSPRSDRARSRTIRPCRSSPSRVRGPPGPGPSGRAAEEPPVPTSAFCWQWPCSSTRPGRGSRDRSGVPPWLGDERIDKLADAGDQVGVGAEPEVAVLVNEGQQAARLAARGSARRDGPRRPASPRSPGQLAARCRAVLSRSPADRSRPGPPARRDNRPLRAPAPPPGRPRGCCRW